MKTRDNLRYDIAAEKARVAIEELRLASYEQGYKDAKHDLTAKVIIEKTPQQIRDESVEKAKRDVERLTADIGYTAVNYGSGKFGTFSVPEFHINNEKRTIVVLIRRKFQSNEIFAKGIAKSDPSDCFNVHLGKAIALRRALGLEVPKEYLKAPQPTEVRVGDVVACFLDGRYSFTHKTNSERDIETVTRDLLGKGRHWTAKLIDDSRCK